MCALMDNHKLNLDICNDDVMHTSLTCCSSGKTFEVGYGMSPLYIYMYMYVCICTVIMQLKSRTC